MYTGTIFNWHDNSGFEITPEVVDTTNRPLYMVVNSFDKGPEKLTEVDANNFSALYGTMSYDRHGQGAIQAQNIIDAGGRLLVKRVCANDSGLANSVLVAKIEDEVEEGKGNLLSWEIKSIDSISAGSQEAAPKTFNEVKREALKLYDPANRIYPLFIITDIGRGISNKAVRIIPDYDTGRSLGKMIYMFNIYEGTTLMENANISLDPSYIYNGDYYGLDKNRMTQVTGEVIPEIYQDYVATIADLVYPEGETPYTAEEIAEHQKIVSSYDLINAYTYKGDEILIEVGENEGDIALTIKLDESGNIDGADLNVLYGNKFNYVGDYGTYGESPAKYGNGKSVYDFYTGDDKDLIKNAEPALPSEDDPTYPDIFAKRAYRRLVLDIASVYLGFDTDNSPINQVWDVDTYKIFAIVDANYHKTIKDCIANFVNFRKDCLFLRDCNIGFYDVKSAQDIYLNYILDNSLYKDFSSYQFNGESAEKAKVYTITSNRSRFIADYGSTYEVIDPTSKKNIEVTMLFDMVTNLTNLYIDQGPFFPLAGTYNGFKLGNAISGTINFVPIITPSGNQKQAIDDIKLNYALFEDEDTCVVQSNYTSQNMNSQLSFINNVLAIQEVARVVRVACPRNRFRLITGSDLSEYANAVSRVLQSYNTYFETLEFKYTEDKLRSTQKIFYASINFAFNNWAQTEIFDLYALSNTSTTSVNS